MLHVLSGILSSHPYITSCRYNPKLFYLIAQILNDISHTVRHFNKPPPVTLPAANQTDLLLRQLLSDIRGWQGSLVASHTGPG